MNTSDSAFRRRRFFKITAVGTLYVTKQHELGAGGRSFHSAKRDRAIRAVRIGPPTTIANELDLFSWRPDLGLGNEGPYARLAK